MQIFDIHQLQTEQDSRQAAYLEFLRSSSLSVGLYSLPAQGIDPQQPHTEDEVYYVVKGSGSLEVGEESCAVEASSVIFVAAGVKHHFHSITEDMTILVFFAPPEYSLKRGEEAMPRGIECSF
ncbi:MAG: cupin domain-containing protein [Chloroflexota bacterium]|nr:cupin domain-containing protein [Chloroflexota bacterium]